MTASKMSQSQRKTTTEVCRMLNGWALWTSARLRARGAETLEFSGKCKKTSGSVQVPGGLGTIRRSRKVRHINVLEKREVSFLGTSTAVRNNIATAGIGLALKAARLQTKDMYCYQPKRPKQFRLGQTLPSYGAALRAVKIE